MRVVRFYFRPFRKPLAGAYGKAAGEANAREALQRFEILLPDIPYIGGGKNAFTITLVKIAAKLAMYRTLRARGASVEQAARLIHLGEVGFYQSVPTRWLMRLQGRGFLSQKGIDMWRRIAATSQDCRYPGDWVYEVVEGDGSDSGMALDCIECGALKYLEREGAAEFTPFLCWIDYPQFAAMRLRLDPHRDDRPGWTALRLPGESWAAGAGRAGVPARLSPHVATGDLDPRPLGL